MKIATTAVLRRVMGIVIATATFEVAYYWFQLWPQPGTLPAEMLDRLFLLMVAIGVATRLWLRTVPDLAVAAALGPLIGAMRLATVTDSPCGSLVCLLLRALDGGEWVVWLQIVAYVVIAGLCVDGLVWGWRRLRRRAPADAVGL